MRHPSNSGKQGPYTDIYAVGAVMYYLVTGDKPVDSIDRNHDISEDEPDPLTPIEKGRGYSDALINAITQSMVLRVNNRTQHVDALQKLLVGKKAFHEQSSSHQSTQGSTDDKTLKIDRTVESELKPTKPAQAKTTAKESDPQQSKKPFVWLLMFIAFSAVGYFGYQGYQQKLIDAALAAENNLKAQQRFQEKQLQAKKAQEEKEKALVVATLKEQQRLAKVAADKKTKEQASAKPKPTPKKKQISVAQIQENKKQAFMVKHNIGYSESNEVPFWVTTPICEDAPCYALVMKYDQNKNWYQQVSKCAVEAVIDIARLNEVRIGGLYKTEDVRAGDDSSFINDYTSVSKQVSDQVFNNITIKSLVKSYEKYAVDKDGETTGSTFEMVAEMMLPSPFNHTIKSSTQTIESTDKVDTITQNQNYVEQFDPLKLSQLLNVFKDSGINVLKIAELKDKQMVACLLSVNISLAAQGRGK